MPFTPYQLCTGPAMMSRTANSMVSDPKLAADRARRAETLRPPRRSGTTRDATRVQPQTLLIVRCKRYHHRLHDPGAAEALPGAHETARAPAVVAGAPPGGRDPLVVGRATARRADAGPRQGDVVRRQRLTLSR